MKNVKLIEIKYKKEATILNNLNIYVVLFIKGRIVLSV